MSSSCPVGWKWGQLTHWGRVTHICLGNITIIGSDNGLSPRYHQAIISTNAEILFTGPLRANPSEILIKILTCSFKTMRLKVWSTKWWPFCLGLNVLIHLPLGLYSLSGKTSYRQISWSLEAARLDVAMVVSLWNLTGTSAASLPRYLPNFRAIGKV